MLRIETNHSYVVGTDLMKTGEFFYIFFRKTEPYRYKLKIWKSTLFMSFKF